MCEESLNFAIELLSAYLSFSTVHLKSFSRVSDTNHGRVLVWIVREVVRPASIRTVNKQRSETNSKPALSSTNTEKRKIYYDKQIFSLVKLFLKRKRNEEYMSPYSTVCHIICY